MIQPNNTLLTVEKKSLKVGAAANLFMALSGWAAFHLSGSEALLLDGNFSFILFLSSLAAINITAVKATRTSTFPFGLFAAESLYSMAKGLLITGVIITAITSNLSKIGSYLAGDDLPQLNTGPILLYSIAMVTICFGLAFFYHRQAEKTGGISAMLKTDKSASLVDGVMSAGTGCILIIIGYVSADGPFSFLLYIGDAIMVLLLACLMIKQPLGIVKQAFIEMAGGRLSQGDDYSRIEQTIEVHLRKYAISAEDIFISKTGSSFLAIASLSASKLGSTETCTLVALKHAIHDELYNHYPFLDVEFTITD
ncbi:hypothetical protein ABT56_16615 [Photobacterium aquae]|uniref:Cation efflux protein transmembrane domain-containing protein n=2 Tax=Photobacterium aquae TaxID=1195763 RepID=A0A0J1JPU8_9GAMM|nr:hypothetical protein ABT56_16615 [Photobacterium aquae]